MNESAATNQRPADMAPVAGATKEPRDVLLLLGEAGAALGGLALVAASWFLPWFTIEKTYITKGAITITGPLASSGWDSLGFLEFNSTKPMGYAVIVCGILAILAVGLILTRPSFGIGRFGLGVMVVATVALGITLYSIANPPGVRYGGITVVNYPVVVTAGGGAMTAIAASLVMAVAGLLAIASNRQRSKSQS